MRKSEIRQMIREELHKLNEKKEIWSLWQIKNYVKNPKVGDKFTVTFDAPGYGTIEYQIKKINGKNVELTILKNKSGKFNAGDIK